jgi:hypothetical protein
MTFAPHKILYGDINKYKTGWACGTYGEKKCIQGLSGEATRNTKMHTLG